MSTAKTQGSSPGCVLLRLMVINTLGDDCLLRIRAIIPLLVKWELGVFQPSNHTWICLLVTAFHTLCTCRHRSVVRWGWSFNTIFLPQINQIKSRALLQIKKKPVFRKIDQIWAFKYLLKQLDESSLLDIVRQVVPHTRASDHKLCVCLCGCVRARAHICVCVWVGLYVCVCVYVCFRECVCVRGVYVCVCFHAYVWVWVD